MVLSFSRPVAVGHFDARGATSNRRLQINAVDVSSDGIRFATAGSDSKIKVWQIVGLEELAAKEESSEELGDNCDSQSEYLLCTISDNEGAVQCLKWSPDGSVLASGDDSALVKVWAPRASSAGTMNLLDNGARNIENWRNVATFKGHTLDVTGLSWSPDGCMLASSSIDSTVRVWEVSPELKNRQLAVIESETRAVLKGHDGWVKDVAFDPVGRYLASVSDDKSVIIWRCSDWHREARVVSPFEKSTGTALRRQLAWSPDGVFLCATHAFDEPRHVAYVIERNKWNDVQNAVRLVGHTVAVSVCAFSPTLYQHRSEERVSSIVAIACDKSTLSIWSPGRSRPVLVCKNVFKGQILDMCWTPDGKQLLMCSMDGFVACVDCRDFATHSGVGAALKPARVKTLLQEYYGDAAGRRASEPAVIETPRQFIMETNLADAQQKDENLQRSPLQHSISKQEADKSRVESLSGTNSEFAVQKESRTLEGRRRISPVSLTQVASATTGPTSTYPAISSTLSPSHAGASTAGINVLQPRRAGASSAQQAQGGLLEARMSLQTLATAPSDISSTVPSSSNSRSTAHPGPEIIIAPPETVGEQLLKAARIPKQFRFHVDCAVGAWVDVNASKESKLVKGPKKSERYETIVTLFNEEGREVWHTMVHGRVCAATANDIAVIVATLTGEVFLLGAMAGQYLLPPIQLSANVACLTASGGRSPFVACVTIDARIIVWDIARKMCVLASSSIDPIRMYGLTTPLKITGGIRAARVLRNTGNANPKELGAASPQPGCDSDEEKSGDSARTGPEDVTQVALSPSGTPVVLLSRCDVEPPTKDSEPSQKRKLDQGESVCFAYAAGMASWVRIADARRFLHSDFYATLDVKTSLDQASKRARIVPQATSGDRGMLYALQQAVCDAAEAARHTGLSPGEKAAELFMFGSDLTTSTEQTLRQKLLSKVHLEELVNSAALLRAPQEYRAWLGQYARRLAEENDEKRFVALCDSLLKSSSITNQSSLEQLMALVGSGDMTKRVTNATNSSNTPRSDLELGWDRHELLRNVVLPAAAHNRGFQGVTAQFLDSLP